ncbi:MAG TPA: hypothetical protein VGK66_03200 [Solirubrobacterales bacterium]
MGAQGDAAAFALGAGATLADLVTGDGRDREGKVEAVPALFVPDRAGRAETTIADMSGVDTVMVTEEPQGGSEEPTGDAIVTMTVSQ